MSPHIGRNLGGFHHMVARRMMVRKQWRRLYGKWMYPPLTEAIVEAVL